MNKPSTRILATSLAIGLTAGYAAAQGSLTPPGAPSPTMKTLEQIEPRIDLATVSGDASYHHVITKSGSYYLSGNLEVTKSNGINIDSAGVTLDLNGFEISRSSGTGGNGININTGTDQATTVRNGTIVGSFSYGIYGQPAKGSLYEKLAVSECISTAIYAGESSRIIDCRVHDNQGNGIFAEKGASLEGCTAYNNQGNGIYTDWGSSLIGCTAHGNQGEWGIRAGNGSSLVGCTAYDNDVNIGIRAGQSSLVGCTAQYNTGTDSVRSAGIDAPGSSIIGCTATYNFNTNSPGTSSQGIGIYGGDGTIKNCTASRNGGDGIQVSDQSVVSGNNCSNNGNGGDGAGIHAKNSSNRIEGNHVTSNDRGIDVDVGNGSVIVRNTARDNGTNYDIAAGNYVGTIQASPVGAGPWDNFSF